MTEPTNLYQYKDYIKEMFVEDIIDDETTDDEIRDAVYEYADSLVPVYNWEIIQLALRFDDWFVRLFVEEFDIAVNDVSIVKLVGQQLYYIHVELLSEIADEYIEHRNQLSAIAEEQGK